MSEYAWLQGRPSKHGRSDRRQLELLNKHILCLYGVFRWVLQVCCSCTMHQTLSQMKFTTALIAVFVTIGVQGKLTPGDIAQLKTWLVCR